MTNLKEGERKKGELHLNTALMASELTEVVDLFREGGIYKPVQVVYTTDWNKASDKDYDLFTDLRFTARIDLKPRPVNTPRIEYFQNSDKAAFTGTRSGTLGLTAFFELNNSYFDSTKTDITELPSEIAELRQHTETKTMYLQDLGASAYVDVPLMRIDGFMVLLLRLVGEKQKKLLGITKDFYTDGEGIAQNPSLEFAMTLPQEMELLDGHYYLPAGLINGNVADSVTSFTRDTEKIVRILYKLRDKVAIPTEIAVGKEGGMGITKDMALAFGSFKDLKGRPQVFCSHCETLYPKDVLDFEVNNGEVVVSNPPCRNCGSKSTNIDWSKSYPITETK